MITLIRSISYLLICTFYDRDWTYYKTLKGKFSDLYACSKLQFVMNSPSKKEKLLWTGEMAQYFKALVALKENQGFVPRYQHGGSQSFVISVPGYLKPFSELREYQAYM